MERGTLTLGYGKYIPKVHFKLEQQIICGRPTGALYYAHLIHTCIDTLEYSERVPCGREILPASGKIFFPHFSALQPYRSQLTSRNTNASSQNKQRGVEKQETGRPEKGNNSALSHQRKKKMGKGDRRRDIAKRSGLGSGRRVMKIMSGRPVGDGL